MDDRTEEPLITTMGGTQSGEERRQLTHGDATYGSEEPAVAAEDQPLAAEPEQPEQPEQPSNRGARRTRALLRLLNVSDPAMLFYLALLVNVPQISVVAIVFPLYWHADDGLCDEALRRYWRVWGGVHALRLGATTVVAGLRWRFHRDGDDQNQRRDGGARRRAAALVANARNSLDAIALIWFVFGNMWLLGGSDDACGAGRNDDRQRSHHHKDDPTKSPIYVVDVVMLAIQYAQICLPCVFAIAMVPVFCFCLPCVIRLLAALHEPNQGRGASRRAINDLPVVTYHEAMDLGGDDEPSCPVCFTTFADGDRLRILPCKHSFHQRCIDEWLNRNASCPLCRRSIFVNDPNRDEPSGAGRGSSAAATSEAQGTRGRRGGGAIEMEAQLATVTVV